VITTRFVDTVSKSRSVAREYNAGPTDEYFAQAIAMRTNQLIDLLATRRGHARVVMDAARAVLHIPKDEEVYVEPPELWKDREARAGRDPTCLWQLKKVLFGRRKVPKCGLKHIGDLLVEAGLMQSRSAPHVFKSRNGQLVLEVHMEDCTAAGRTRSSRTWPPSSGSKLP